MDKDSEERSMVEKTEDDESLDINIRDKSTKELYIKRQWTNGFLDTRVQVAGWMTPNMYVLSL